MSAPRYPSLYQINTRVWLTELSRALSKRATLDDIPEAELDRLAEIGFDWILFLSFWQTGAAAQRSSRANPEWRKDFEATPPDLCEDDIADSGFAIAGYAVHQDLGGDAALARLRQRLRPRGLKLRLDSCPNTWRRITLGPSSTHIFLSRTALLSPGTVGRKNKTDFTPFGARAGRTRR